METTGKIKTSITNSSKMVGGMVGLKLIEKIISNPAIVNTVTNYAATLTTKLISLVSARYPKAITFVTQNLDSLEAKLKEHNSANVAAESTGTASATDSTTLTH